MMDMRLLSKKWFNKGSLYSSKLKEYQDEYHRKLLWEERRNQDKIKIMSSKNRTEQNRTEQMPPISKFIKTDNELKPINGLLKDKKYDFQRKGKPNPS